MNLKKTSHPNRDPGTISLKRPRNRNKKQRDAEIAKVFTGDSDKFLVIVGPCSADNEDAVLEYNHRLAKVAEKYPTN